MINLIVPIVEDVSGFEEFVKTYASKNVKAYVGIRKSLLEKFKYKSKYVEVHSFSDKANCEEIINSLHSLKMASGKLMIVRRPLTKEEFSDLADSQKDIVTLKAKRGGFASSIKKFLSGMVRKFFAFSYFEDISAICYGENLFDLLSVCANLSMASRVNKYVGVEIEEFETDQKPVKKQYDRTKTALLLTLWILLFVASLAGGICVCLFTPLHALTVVLVFAWVFVALMLLFYGVINFFRTIAVGNLRYGKAEEIKI